ncbi:hydrogenase-4 component F [Dyella jiangningensis]|uniref:proton-conducting transporter transmembrane domain-containing protein n=1 Tax=Dyella sp. AtDHG13 TaxID=1938897 RepID=UPI000886B61B|nr:proton-conducting transporter membrane subunit [Dyella sp. AtDHG13]PXV55980.1 hydrogenase-4 component F [Dyella sp. AtDHG13]SDK48029.1 hydrogenase-4 component F [Dyella jiangningensis]
MSASLHVALLWLAPALAVVLGLALRRARVSEWLNLASAVAVFVLAAPLPFQFVAPVTLLHGYLIVDALGSWVVLCVAIVYLLSSIYAIAYMRQAAHSEGQLPVFYALFAGFALSMLVAPLVNSVGVYWIAIELTTLISTFLVGFERNAESMEAAWKYIIVVSSGISLALLGTALLYWGGSFVYGETYMLSWSTLVAAAPHMPPVLLKMGFLLVLIGYGTKVGLAPMHTWLPDAHSEGPAPVSAMLSGALLNTAMVGIVRLLAVTDAAGHGQLPHLALVVLGVFSLVVGALFIVRQRQVKRLMAYSSVEHMGVLALGFGFGGPLGIAGAMYHMLNHSLAKPLLFFGAGNAMQRFGSKRMDDMRGMWREFPVSGAIWLCGAVAITGAPPFGLFLSEFTILRAGWDGPHRWAAIVMLVLLIAIFVAFLNHFRAMYLGEVSEPANRTPIGGAAWRVLPMALALGALLILGLWWPPSWQSVFSGIAQGLGVRP